MKHDSYLVLHLHVVNVELLCDSNCKDIAELAKPSSALLLIEPRSLCMPSGEAADFRVVTGSLRSDCASRILRFKHSTRVRTSTQYNMYERVNLTRVECTKRRCIFLMVRVVRTIQVSCAHCRLTLKVSVLRSSCSICCYPGNDARNPAATTRTS